MIINKLPIGGGKIKDATALPSDVRQGKIFYNNEGRRVGTADIEKEFIYTRPSSDSESMAFNYYQGFDNSGLLKEVYSHTSSL